MKFNINWSNVAAFRHQLWQLLLDVVKAVKGELL